MLKQLSTQPSLEVTRANPTDVSEILLDRVADWLTRSALDGHNLDVMVRGFASVFPRPACRSCACI